MTLKKYWQKAIGFEEYLEIAKQRLENPKNEAEKEYQEYYELGIQRIERILKTFKINEVQEQKFRDKSFSGKILIISEAWCGDASATVPAVNQFFKKNGVEVQIFLRDSDTSLIDQFFNQRNTVNP